jgi:hypothetical protein
LKALKAVRSEQERTGINQAAGIEADIDHILATEEELLPSSGFLSSVMERVEEEAAAPQPIPFPWKRATPGILLALGVFGWGAVELVRLAPELLRSLALTSLHLTADAAVSLENAAWVAVALGFSLASWLMARRLAGGGGLL